MLGPSIPGEYDNAKEMTERDRDRGNVLVGLPTNDLAINVVTRVRLILLIVWLDMALVPCFDVSAACVGSVSHYSI